MLLQGGGKKLYPRDVGINVILEHACPTWSSLFLTRRKNISHPTVIGHSQSERDLGSKESRV